MVEIALILVVSELSYRFIEHPLTRLSYKDVWTQFTEFLRKPWDLREKGTMAFMTVISVIAGDSVILDGASGLQDIFPKMIIDGEVGRQLYSSISLSELDKKKMLKDTVLVSLGTNGPFTEAQFDEFMKALGNRKVYWINVRVPTRRWQNQVNSLLSQMDKNTIT